MSSIHWKNHISFQCFDSFSPTCHLTDGEEVVCDQCAPGYSGAWCERYFVALQPPVFQSSLNDFKNPVQS